MREEQIEIETAVNECVEALRAIVCRRPVCAACTIELLVVALQMMLSVGQIPHWDGAEDEPELPFDAIRHATVQ